MEPVSVSLASSGTLISAIILFLLSAVFPIFLGYFLSRKSLIKMLGFGKGFLIGSVVAGLYNILDVYIERYIEKACYMCFLDNFPSGAFAILYFVLGLIFFLVGKARLKKYQLTQ